MERPRRTRKNRRPSGRVHQCKDRVSRAARPLRWRTADLRAPNRKIFVVCGPTASGKTGIADRIAETLTTSHGARVPTIVVDSMQVYRELPIITNQQRSRPAEMVGIVSVTEEWTVAKHRFRCDEIIDGDEGPSVLDAGTGMYLNALLLDMEIAGKTPAYVRREAERLSTGSTNSRRAARQKELEMVGAPPRGSIWEGALRYDTTLIYLRPHRDDLDRAIAARSLKITREGLDEAATISRMSKTGEEPNPSVKDSIGVRELVDHLTGGISLREAETRINSRTRRLARRQMRWFDKLMRTLHGRAELLVAENREELAKLHTMHDKILL